MRLATYNVEWFDALFDDSGRLRLDNAPSGRHGVSRREQAEALGIVFNALDADAVMVIEAPDTNRRRSTVRALENFAAEAGIRARRALWGFDSDTQQEIALLYDPDRLDVAHDPRGGATGARGLAEAPRFDGVFRLDLDADDRPEAISFSKPPLEVAARARGSGFAFRMIGVHVKSKAPHGAANPEAATRLAIANRRKQLAQCVWLRQRVLAHLEAGEPLIVLGDFNDGPGLDEYEKLFGRSGVEVVMGWDDPPDRQLFDPNAREALTARAGTHPTSARFFLPERRRWLSALLDYIMVSPDLMARRPTWRIWNPLEDYDCWKFPELREALLTASDHFPVTLDIEL